MLSFCLYNPNFCFLMWNILESNLLLYNGSLSKIFTSFQLKWWFYSSEQNLHFSADFREASSPAIPLTARPAHSPNATPRLGASNIQRHEMHGTLALIASSIISSKRDIYIREILNCSFQKRKRERLFL